MEEKETKILNVALADFCESGTTITVEAEDGEGRKETFHVQTADGRFRADLGCWLLHESIDGDVENKHFPTFDLIRVMGAADDYIKREMTEHREYGCHGKIIYLLHYGDERIDVVVENGEFINPDTSTYMREFSDPLGSFDTREEALEWLEERERNNDYKKK